MGKFNIKRVSFFYIVFIFLCWPTASVSQTMFTYMAPNGQDDTRNLYEKDLLNLALTLTENEYGEFSLQASDSGVNLKRTEMLAKKGHFKNFFFKFSYRDELKESLLPIYIPIDRGIVGYRISFVSLTNPDIIKTVSAVNQLKNLTIVQGIGWLDANILSTNGLSVFTISNYEKMFEMISNDRAELFFRGVNEWQAEYDTYKNRAVNLACDQHIALHYPLPRFFFTSKDNIKNAERVQKGLLLAYENGEFVKLWRKYFSKSIKASKLSSRTIIELSNPYLNDLSPEYKKYNATLAEIKAIEMDPTIN